MVRRTYYLPAEVVARLDRAIAELTAAAYVDRAPSKAEVLTATILAGLERRDELVASLREITGSGSQHVPTTRDLGWHRPVELPDSLHELEGPTRGVVTLPPSVHSSGAGHEQRFDLDDDRSLATVYEIVLTEGACEDLRCYLDEAELRRRWSSLFLPAYVRTAWERRFPELVS